MATPNDPNPAKKPNPSVPPGKAPPPKPAPTQGVKPAAGATAGQARGWTARREAAGR